MLYIGKKYWLEFIYIIYWKYTIKKWSITCLVPYRLAPFLVNFTTVTSIPNIISVKKFECYYVKVIISLLGKLYITYHPFNILMSNKLYSILNTCYYS